MSLLAENDLDQKLRDAQPGAELNGGTMLLKEEYMYRRKRVVGMSARGLAATQKLLVGAQKVKTSSKKFRNYRKDGNYETALADFNSVEPVLTRKKIPWSHGRQSLARHKFDNSLIGTVGETRLILRKYGDTYSNGSPVLEIRSALDVLYNRIVYD